MTILSLLRQGNEITKSDWDGVWDYLNLLFCVVGVTNLCCVFNCPCVVVVVLFLFWVLFLFLSCLWCASYVLCCFIVEFSSIEIISCRLSAFYIKLSCRQVISLYKGNFTFCSMMEFPYSNWNNVIENDAASLATFHQIIVC